MPGEALPSGAGPGAEPRPRRARTAVRFSLLLALAEPRDRPRFLMAGKKLIVVFGATGELLGERPGPYPGVPPHLREPRGCRRALARAGGKARAGPYHSDLPCRCGGEG